MRKLILCLVMLLAIPSGLVAAQSDCGNGLPCGPIPWRLPHWPAMQSPTPIGTQADFLTVTYTPTPTPTNTPTPTPTNTPTPTPTATFTPQDTATPFLTDVPIQDNVATAQAAAEVTEEVVYNPEGTPIAKEDATALIDPMIFSYIKGLSSDIFGPFEPVVMVLIIGFGLNMLLLVIKLVLFVGSVALGYVRKAVEFIMEIIPL